MRHSCSAVGFFAIAAFMVLNQGQCLSRPPSHSLQAPAQPAVERWDVFELEFQSARRYANPFREVSLTITFTDSAARKIQVAGFYDGGNTWRARFMAVEEGRWAYESQSNDPELNGKRGSVDCLPPTKSYLRGPLQAEGNHFRHPDGTYRFLISTRLSCQYAPPSVWERAVRFLAENRINRVLFMVGGVHGQTKDLYGSGGTDLWSYNVERFQAIDRFIDGLRKAGIFASPYFFYFNDSFQKNLTPEQDEAFLRYGMARFGAYSNVMPVLANEVEQKYSTRKDATYDSRNHEWANQMGGLLKQLAVFSVPVAVHNPMESFEARNPGFFTLLQDWPFPWTDFMLRQAQVGALGSAPELGDDIPEPIDPTWNARAYARHNEVLASLRRRFSIPIINEEPGYEMEGTRSWNGQTPATVRSTFWTATTAGAYAMWGNPATYGLDDPLPFLQGSRTPFHLRTLAKIMEALPFWKMAPSNDLVNPNLVTVCGEPFRRNFALAKPGDCYLIYSLDGGQLEVKVEPGDYEVRATRLSDVPPAYPLRLPDKRLSAKEGKVSFYLTNSIDWVAVLQRVK